ncbi:hypothetical protein [uncultured Aquitalea sp.]|uniref:hypothetical protein n=1 Tax=uncultured Aquitalea sp. TaxID=540272 RepID=UPI0025CBEEFE|nr:hypothetical protein [uncultured Aquitalea sp.]
MKKAIIILAGVAALYGAPSLAAEGGTISFTGTIVKEPCAQAGNTLVSYATQPRLYAAARKVSSGPSCSGMDNTQSLTLSALSMNTTTSSGQVVTVVYN